MASDFRTRQYAHLSLRSPGAEEGVTEWVSESSSIAGHLLMLVVMDLR